MSQEDLTNYPLYKEGVRLKKFLDRQRKKRREERLKRIADKLKQQIYTKRKKRLVPLRVKKKNKRLRREKIEQKKRLLKKQGWKETYVRQDISVRNRRARDLNICKQVYDMHNSGFTIKELMEYFGRSYGWVFRYKLEYKAYLDYLEKKSKEETDKQTHTTSI